MAKQKETAAAAGIPEILKNGEVVVGEETIMVTLTNPADPVEKLICVQRTARAIAFIVNDVAPRVLELINDIKPFQE